MPTSHDSELHASVTLSSFLVSSFLVYVYHPFLLFIVKDEARKLTESLKESREGKLHRKRKRTESMQNLLQDTEQKQQTIHPPLIDALNVLITSHSRKRTETAKTHVQAKTKKNLHMEEVTQRKEDLCPKHNSYIHTAIHNHHVLSHS